MHLPEYYNDEQWNELSDEERERSSALYDRAEMTDDEDINAQITALYEEADEYEANAEGTSDIMKAQALRDEAEQLINILRARHNTA